MQDGRGPGGGTFEIYYLYYSPLQEFGMEQSGIILHDWQLLH